MLNRASISLFVSMSSVRTDGRTEDDDGDGTDTTGQTNDIYSSKFQIRQWYQDSNTSVNPEREGLSAHARQNPAG